MNLGLNMILFMRYVDDIDDAVESVKKSIRYDHETDTLVDDKPGEDENLLKTDSEMM